MSVYDKRSMESEICKRCADKTCYGYDHRITECEDYQPETNADRIRSMTDEELANFITDIDGDYPCPPDNSCSCSSSNCMKGWLDWLKEEVKE